MDLTVNSIPQYFLPPKTLSALDKFIESLQKFIVRMFSDGIYDSASVGDEVISKMTFDDVLEHLASAKIKDNKKSGVREIGYNLKIHHADAKQFTFVDNELCGGGQYNTDRSVDLKIEEAAGKLKLWVGDKSIDLPGQFNSLEKVQQYIRDSLCKTKWREQGVPESYLDALVELKDASNDESIESALRSLRRSSLNNAAVAVTCNASGDLVLELHLFQQNKLNKIVEIKTIEENFYQRILQGGALVNSDFSADACMKLAVKTRDEISNLSDSQLDGWTIKNFFDLVCEYKKGEFGNKKPDFYLDLMGSGETITKYTSATDPAEPDTPDFNNPYAVSPPHLYKTQAQLDAQNRAKLRLATTQSPQPSCAPNASHSNNVRVINGPTSLRGIGFDANVISGFFELVQQIADGKKNLQISGHSRGAVEAICVNNLLVGLSELIDQVGVEDAIVNRFVTEHLATIKQNYGNFLPATTSNEEEKDSGQAVKALIKQALTQMRNGQPKVRLTLSDPVQGPDCIGFSHKAFSIAKTLRLNKLHDRVDIIMGSYERQSVGFDLHLPLIEKLPNTTAPCSLYKTNSGHGNMVKELHKKPLKDGSYRGKNTGSVEGHFAASVLSGRTEEVQGIEALSNNPKTTRQIISSYTNRVRVYAASAFRALPTNSPQSPGSVFAAAQAEEYQYQLSSWYPEYM